MATDYINVDAFVSKSFIGTNAGGLLRPNKFLVHVHPPEFGLTTNNKLTSEILSYNAIAFSCPPIEMDLGSYDYNSWYHWYFKRRVDVDLTIMFLESADLQIRRFFDKWIGLGFNNETRNRQYLEDLESTLELFPLDREGNKKFKITFLHSFPYKVDPLEFNVEDRDQILKTIVSFKYKIQKIEEVKA